MANGVMPGSGTREDPFIVEDGWDFNALRNVPAINVDTVSFIELGADINLGMFPNFTPIPNRFFNIDGKGYVIQNVTVAASGASFGLDAGLFASLTSTEYIRNITIEGIVSVRSSGTGTGRVGLLAASLNTAGATGNNVVYENIELYGSVEVASQGSTTSVILGGGLAAHLSVASNQRATIRNCFFRGVAHSIISNTATTGAPTLVFGGLIGRIDLSFQAVAAFDLCITDVDLFVSGTNGTRIGVFGGICGDCSGPTNTSTPGRMIAILSSIGKLAVNFNNIGAFDRPQIYAGLMGRNDTSTASSMAAGMSTEIINCGGFLTINFDPSFPVGAQDFNGIHGQGVRTGTVSSSYAVIEYNNPNDRELPAVFNIHGLGHVNAAGNVFFDETVLRKTWSGDVSQPARGRTTSQLQSQTYLESQGWVFVDV